VNPRSLLAFAHDVAAAALAWAAAFWLRFNLDIPPYFEGVLLACLPWVALVHAVVFWAMGLYRGLWRFASLPDLRRILISAGIAALAVPALLNVLRLSANVPRTAYLLAPILLVLMMGGSRLAYRAWKEGRIAPLIGKPQATPVLVLGAGDAAAALLKDLASSREWRVVGVLDDEARKHGGEIHGVKVLGSIDRAAEFAERLEVGQVIIAMPGASHQARRRATDLCVDAGLEVMTVPALADIVAGRVSVSALRHVELDDLLGRDPVELDLPGLQGFIGGKTVLVTGAGGSIGAELCRQIARFAPERLVLFDLSEFALYTIEQEFRDRLPGIELVAAIGDAKNPDRVREVMRRWRPQIVFHAAAYKHVPLMEDENAFEAVRNNVLGTLAVARAAIEANADKFVLVSTDKAVNPTNVMGASKRVAELVCQALKAPGGTQFVIVRFGNVLGSAGSVVPRFREQIARGGPVTVTHPEIRRYFMSIPEAAQLVLQAGLMGKAGEIFVLDMGEPVKIADLARELIRLSGFTGNEIQIVYTGLRPGEKLFEELLADTETTLPTPHPKLRVAKANEHENLGLVEEVERWLGQPSEAEAAAVRAQLRVWVPEYTAPPAAGGIARE
jgi:FlaA1/EpsC-like NDP-sugar epimerase